MGSCLRLTTGGAGSWPSRCRGVSGENALGGFSARDSSRRWGAGSCGRGGFLKAGDDPRPRTTVEALTGSAIASYTYGCRRRCSRWIPPDYTTG